VQNILFTVGFFCPNTVFLIFFFYFPPPILHHPLLFSILNLQLMVINFQNHILNFLSVSLIHCVPLFSSSPFFSCLHLLWLRVPQPPAFECHFDKLSASLSHQPSIATSINPIIIGSVRRSATGVLVSNFSLVPIIPSSPLCPFRPFNP
jgi:hypothetical protein